jgi:hypothetical protein
MGGCQTYVWTASGEQPIRLTSTYPCITGAAGTQGFNFIPLPGLPNGPPASSVSAS